jgi:hypothetical protein
MLSQQPNDIKLEVIDLFLEQIGNLRFTDHEKFLLVPAIDKALQVESSMNFLQLLLNVENIQKLFENYISESEDFLQDEAMRQ